MNWELIGKIGGTDIQVHPVEVEYLPNGGTADREVLKVPGEPGSQYLITLLGHYENSQSIDTRQLRWRTESSDWTLFPLSSRGGQAQAAVLAQAGDTLTVGQGATDRFYDASFIGKAYITPVPEISEEEGNTTSFPVGPVKVAGRDYTENLVADLEVPPGEVWRVKVTGTFTWSGFVGSNAYPSVMIGSKQSSLTAANATVEIEAHVSTVSRISIITDSTEEMTFEGTVEITPMKW